MADKWIQGAIKHPGALTAKAKAAGESLSQFMREKHKDPTTNRQIALARRLREFAQHRKGKIVTFRRVAVRACFVRSCFEVFTNHEVQYDADHRSPQRQRHSRHHPRPGGRQDRRSGRALWRLAQSEAEYRKQMGQVPEQDHAQKYDGADGRARESWKAFAAIPNRPIATWP